MEAPYLQGTPQYEATALSSSGGTVITADAAANTKGAYSQLIAATTMEWLGFLLVVDPAQTGAAYVAVDIAIGAAASEIDILKNFHCSWKNATNQEGAYSIFIPLRVPVGSRVAARIQSDVGGRTVRVSCLGYGASARVTPVFEVCETYGFTAGTTRGVSSDPGGSANTKGSYVEITASTNERTKAIIITTGLPATSSAARRALDFAIGAAASEIILIPNIRYVSLNQGDNYVPSFHGPFPVNIAAATRLAARTSSSTTSASERPTDVVAYCFR